MSVTCICSSYAYLPFFFLLRFSVVFHHFLLLFLLLLHFAFLLLNLRIKMYCVPVSVSIYTCICICMFIIVVCNESSSFRFLNFVSIQAVYLQSHMNMFRFLLCKFIAIQSQLDYCLWASTSIFTCICMSVCMYVRFVRMLFVYL